MIYKIFYIGMSTKHLCECIDNCQFDLLAFCRFVVLPVN